MWVKSRKVGPGKRQQCWDDGTLAMQEREEQQRQARARADRAAEGGEQIMIFPVGSWRPPKGGGPVQQHVARIIADLKLKEFTTNEAMSYCFRRSERLCVRRRPRASQHRKGGAKTNAFGLV